MSLSQSEHIADTIPNIALIWDKRRTKPEAKARAVQDTLVHTVGLTRDVCIRGHDSGGKRNEGDDAAGTTHASPHTIGGNDGPKSGHTRQSTV
jgi:hypothetical protein